MDEFANDLLSHLVNLVLAITLAEMAWMPWLMRRSGAGRWPWRANLLAGLGLLVALRLVLSNAHWMWVGLALACAGIAHLSDLRARWRRHAAHLQSGP